MTINPFKEDPINHWLEKEGNMEDVSYFILYVTVVILWNGQVKIISNVIVLILTFNTKMLKRIKYVHFINTILMIAWFFGYFYLYFIYIIQCISMRFKIFHLEIQRIINNFETMVHINFRIKYIVKYMKYLGFIQVT